MDANRKLETKKQTKPPSNEFDQVKEVIKHKATKHSEFYKNLLNQHDKVSDVSSSDNREMAPQAAEEIQTQTSPANLRSSSTSTLSDTQTTNVDIVESSSSQNRTRKNGVFQMHDGKQEENIIFPSVRSFINKYTDLINQMDEKNKKKIEKIEEGQNEEGFLVPPTPSGYCSSSNNSDDERNWTNKKNSDVKRCCSSDSALGLLQSDEERSVSPNVWPKTKKTKCEKVPVHNPYLRRASIDHFNVPTKTLIEASIVPFPLNRKLSECDSIEDLEGKFDSRRQSCITDDGEEPPRYRYWRTPSVVVSDYSDDVIGLTLEDIEYLRNQRKSVTSSPDSSLNSSCSNLNYCGSSVSVLDGDYTLRTPSRKSSDCSTLSNFSTADDDDDDHRLQPLTNVVYGNKVSGIMFIITLA